MTQNRFIVFLWQFIIAYRKLIALLLLFAGLLIFLMPRSEDIPNKKQKITHTVHECDRSKHATAPIESIRLMNDLNEIQNEHARMNGLKHVYETNLEFENDSAQLVREMQLVKIKNNPLYHVKELTHSYPYCTPEAADLLNTIATLFKEKLSEKDGGNYRFLVSSVLRTEEFQNQLMRRNRNASSQSAHLFGTTIDITYKEFYNVDTDSIEPDFLANDALRETMLELREQCRLLVVREKRQAVYHFTVVNCDPLKANAQL